MQRASYENKQVHNTLLNIITLIDSIDGNDLYEHVFFMIRQMSREKYDGEYTIEYALSSRVFDMKTLIDRVRKETHKNEVVKV